MSCSVEFLKKLCPVGQMLAEKADFNQHLVLSERKEYFDETGNYASPDETRFNEHLKSCPVCFKNYLATKNEGLKK